MKKNNIQSFFVLLAVAATLQSCFVAKDYERPDIEEVSSDLYRTDALSSDSTSMAKVSWQSVFSDPILKEHIASGLENNMDIRIALQRIEVANAYYKQGRAGYLPSLNVNAQATHQELSRNSQFGSFFNGGLTQYELNGALSWEADVWGKIRSNRRATNAAYLQTVAAHQAVKSQLVSNIATNYFQLLMLDEQLRVVEETIANRLNSVETTKALKEAGQVTEVAVKQTEAQLKNAEATRLDLLRDILLAENTLSILLGTPPQSIARSQLETQELTVAVEMGYPVQLLRNRPDVIAAEYGLIQAFEMTNVARSNFYPSLTLSATGGFQSLELDEWLSANSLFANFVAGLAQPIFNKRQIRTQYEVAKAQQEEALLEFRNALLVAGKEVSDAYYAIETATEKVDVKTDEYEAYNAALVYSEELLDNGMANYLEVLTARESTLNAQLALAATKFEKLQATVMLYKALGGGW